MITTATDTQTRSIDSTSERDSLRRDHGVHAIGGIANPGAFDFVLDVARSVLEVQVRQSGSGSTAPEQMFEPTEPGAHGQRQAALRAAAPRDAGTTGAEHLDQTSVGVRRESARGAGSGGASFSSATTVAAKQPALHGGGDASSEAVSAHHGRTESNAAKSDGTYRLAALDPSAAREARNHLVKDAQPVVEVPNEGFDGAPGAVKVSAAVQQPSSTSRADGVAGKVGQVLGASGVGGSESARAPQGAEPAPDGRTQSETQRQTSRALPSERSSGERPSPQTETGERTRQFDELVRSIRLRQGSHRSSAKMHLNPPELGRVSIDVRMEGERLHVDVRTEHAEAAKLLHERVVQLRTALAEHDIVIERFDVGAEMDEHSDSFETPEESSGEPAGQEMLSHDAAPPSASEAIGMFEGEPGEAELEADEFQADAERRLDVRV